MCFATIQDPYQCCTSNSTVYECCRGLPLCLPPIPLSVHIKPWTGLDWIGNITEETCKPFSNGFKELLFVIRISIGQFVYWFIQDSPTSYAKGFWQFFVGWMTFPNNKLPPYAFVCFAFNIGGLLLLFFIVILIWIWYEGFADFFTDLADIFQGFMLQSEFDNVNQGGGGGIPSAGFLTMSSSLSILGSSGPGPRTRGMMALRQWLATQGTQGMV